MSSPEAFIFVNYARTADLKFNTEYYLNDHIAIVKKHWTSFGLKSCSVVQFPKGDPSGLHTQTILHFESLEAFERAWAANIPEVMEDLPHFSNQVPTRYCGQVMKLA